ncbi:MAG: RNA methyltransferase [Myxococcales bacterium]|nr:RNA methyltransferase [Myxococcales bacterium]USN51449.1 MAG: RNA methyltransferase [Myxococcales bacterium]
MSEKTIKSKTNPIIKKWVRLRSKREERLKENAAIVIGSHVIRELISVLSPRLIIIRENAPIPKDAPWTRASDEIIQKICALPMLPDWIAEFPLPQNSSFDKCQRLLILDQVKDPGNLGTILRTSLAFGWHHIFLLNQSADPFAPKALQASKGACFRLNIKIGTIDDLKKIIAQNSLNVYIADLKGAPPKTSNTIKPLALVLGSEVKGISEQMYQLGHKVSLPMTQESESLNVAIAGAILMYLWRA